VMLHRVTFDGQRRFDLCEFVIVRDRNNLIVQKAVAREIALQDLVVRTAVGQTGTADETVTVGKTGVSICFRKPDPTAATAPPTAVAPPSNAAASSPALAT
jgi:hypothetical protein